MKFNKIVSVDDAGLTEAAQNAIQKYSRSAAVFHEDDPKDVTDAIKRINNADCVLVSWRTKIDGEVLEKCRNIKYIGLCCTSFSNVEFSNVDMKETERRRIVVSNVAAYGDEATAEYIFAQLLSLARGFGKYRWKESPCELFGKTLGIIGLGAVGSRVARLGLGFGMNVIYYSRTRKPESEEKGAKFMPLHGLIKNSDVVSLHVPKGVKIFSKREFDLMPEGSILVDTCLGKVFNEADFLSWIRKGKNFAVFDYSVGEDFFKRFRNLRNVIFPIAVAGATEESRRRLSAAVVKNLESFLKGKPINVVN